MTKRKQIIIGSLVLAILLLLGIGGWSYYKLNRMGNTGLNKDKDQQGLLTVILWDSQNSVLTYSDSVGEKSVKIENVKPLVVVAVNAPGEPLREDTIKQRVNPEKWPTVFCSGDNLEFYYRENTDDLLSIRNLGPRGCAQK